MHRAFIALAIDSGCATVPSGHAGVLVTPHGVQAAPLGEVEAILIRDVELPPTIRQAIDDKLAAEQQVLEMRYVLEVAKANAQEKQIEAQAIADYNKTVAASLSPPILEFERIQQMTRLAGSQSVKTVLIGGGNSPPLMLAAPATAGH